jgi:hypothetical protein
VPNYLVRVCAGGGFRDASFGSLASLSVGVSMSASLSAGATVSGFGVSLLASPLVSGFENAINQWREGERRLSRASPEQSNLLQRIADTLVVELRKRLGGRFSAEELAELYGRGTSWCLQLAMEIAPEDPWAWDSRTVVDAAFARYLREAVDYAGGRLIPTES